MEDMMPDKIRTADVSVVKLAKIVAARRAGYSVRQIAKGLRMSPSAAYRALRRIDSLSEWLSQIESAAVAVDMRFLGKVEPAHGGEDEHEAHADTSR